MTIEIPEVWIERVRAAMTGEELRAFLHELPMPENPEEDEAVRMLRDIAEESESSTQTENPLSSTTEPPTT